MTDKIKAGVPAEEGNNINAEKGKGKTCSKCGEEFKFVRRICKGQNRHSGESFYSGIYSCGCSGLTEIEWAHPLGW
jgi:hypothetical protein